MLHSILNLKSERIQCKNKKTKKQQKQKKPCSKSLEKCTDVQSAKRFRSLHIYRNANQWALSVFISKATWGRIQEYCQAIHGKGGWRTKPPHDPYSTLLLGPKAEIAAGSWMQSSRKGWCLPLIHTLTLCFLVKGPRHLNDWLHIICKEVAS